MNSVDEIHAVWSLDDGWVGIPKAVRRHCYTHTQKKYVVFFKVVKFQMLMDMCELTQKRNGWPRHFFWHFISSNMRLLRKRRPISVPGDPSCWKRALSCRWSNKILQGHITTGRCRGEVHIFRFTSAAYEQKILLPSINTISAQTFCCKNIKLLFSQNKDLNINNHLNVVSLIIKW
jgi:hypothetical protein